MSLRALRARLDETLFPAPGPTSARSGARWEAVAIWVCLIALAIFAQLLRQGLGISLDSLWAEDGFVFLQGAMYEGLWHTLLSPYAEYLVVVPRLIGGAAAGMPIGAAAATTSILSALTVGVSGLVVWFAAAPHIRDPYLRGALVLATVLCPVAGSEAVDTSSYVSWYMVFACFWVLFWRPRTTAGASLGGLFLLLTGLSNPGVMLLAPVALLRAIAIRDRRDAIVVAAFAASVAIQLPVLATHNEQGAEPTWTADIWTAYLQRALSGGLLGEEVAGTAWIHLGWSLLIGMLALALAGLGAIAAFGSNRVRALTAIAVVASLGLFVFSAYQRQVGSVLMWPAGEAINVSCRYVIVPALLVLSCLLIGVDERLRRQPRSFPAWRLLPLALVALAVATSFSVGDANVRGTPSWSDSLDEGRAKCAQEEVDGVAVPISPPPFGVSVPCDRLEG